MTMLNRAHCLSSLADLFAEECDNLKGIFWSTHSATEFYNN